MLFNNDYSYLSSWSNMQIYLKQKPTKIGELQNVQFLLLLLLLFIFQPFIVINLYIFVICDL
jgi:hypothetical protein